MRRAIAFLLDPGPPRWDTLVLRVVLATVYIPIGLGKWVNHDEYVERFERWGFGAASGELAVLVGILEVVGGLMLLLGGGPRRVAVALTGNMIGALATAGRVDGGQDIWLPIVLIVLLAAVIVLGAGKWALDGWRALPGRARA